MPTRPGVEGQEGCLCAKAVTHRHSHSPRLPRAHAHPAPAPMGSKEVCAHGAMSLQRQRPQAGLVAGPTLGGKSGKGSGTLRYVPRG